LQSLLYARIQGASLRDPLVPAGTEFLLGFAAQRFVRLPTASRLSPSHRRRPAGAVTAYAAEEATGSQAGPLRLLIDAALREVADPKRGGAGGLACLGPLWARRQLVAMKQPNGAARPAAPPPLERWDS
jgi:hypothetical protein